MTEIYSDSLHKIAYSTDGSIYREVPVGVAFPHGEKDITELIAEARRRGTHIIPRAAGTSVAGQVVGSGIVADISRHMNRVLEINAAERWARVEPGVVRDQLNIALKPYGLFFSPETSTSNRCCIGGMMGNNSCGTHSLVYGSTRHHVIEATGILADGTTETFRQYSVAELEHRFGTRFWEHDPQSLAQSIYSQLINFALDDDTVQLITDNYPDRALTRRSCGYAIDEVIDDLHDNSKPLTERTVNLCQLLAGSEGTLAFTTSVTVSLDPLPPREIMAVCAHCDTLEKSLLANLVALEHNPTAIELMDRPILELSKDNPEQQTNRFFVKGDPAAIIIIELRAGTRDELDSRATRLEEALTTDNRELVYACSRVYGDDVARVWNLRKAGLGTLSGMKGDTKPIGVIEDTAVAPQFLPAYITDFDTMLHRLGAQCVYYGHISTGELHLRPILNLKTEHGKRLFRELAHETAMLVKKHRGSISGEHGDGRLRGEFIKLLYGNETYELMRQVKQCWDPDGIFNIHKIVDTLPMDDCLRYDVGQQYKIQHEIQPQATYFNWKADFDKCTLPQASGARSQVHALMCTVEQCNGAGDCRKETGGTMCPAFRVSCDETRSTRARANVLREVLTRGWQSEVFDHIADKRGSIFAIPELREVLDSCLACKACRRECPSNVDMTRLRAEALQHRYDTCGTPMRVKMVAHLATIEALGARVPALYNFMATNPHTSALIKKIAGFAPERSIPTLCRHSMTQLVKNEKGDIDGNRKVYLFADEFTNHQESQLGLAFAHLLGALGYQVVIPKHTESGRAAISKGCLKRAQKLALHNVSALKDIVTGDAPLVGIEPSCILSFRDEYPDLVPDTLREQAIELGNNALLYDEFLLREIEAGRISPDSFNHDPLVVWLHGHCHQKALVGIDKTVTVLQRLLGATVNVVPSGCCGMAGSFGYERKNYRDSLAIGEMVLFPTLRRAVRQQGETPMVVAAPGTSCRQQIKDGTGINAHHPISIIAARLKSH